MYWLILVGAMGQLPDVPARRTFAEIRHTLNRIDDLSSAAIEAKALQVAEENKAESNAVRKAKIVLAVRDFAEQKLSIAKPFQDAETVVMEQMAARASSKFDRNETVNAAPAPPPRQWYNTVGGKVWGWLDVNGVVQYYPHEQPQPYALTPTPSFQCVNGRCYRSR